MEFHDNEIVFSSKTAVAKFEECRQNLRFCDVTLQSGQVAVKAHRVVLAAASPYFEALFKDDLQEHKELVNCSDIPSDVLPTLVDFLYTGHVTFQSSTAHELIEAAHMLHLDSLITGCARYLRTQLNTSNALSMLSFAETLGCTKLTEYALDYIEEYWTVIAQRKELLELSLTTFITILSSDRFVTDNELGVIFAIVRWLEHKPAARAPHCFELVRHLRLGRVPADIMDEIWRVVRDMRVMGGLELYKMEAIANARVRSRGAFFTVKSGRISKYDVNKNVWEDLVAMDACREDHSLVALGSRVYMVGGQEGSQRLRSGEAYDLATNKWSPIASLNEGRSHFALAALKGKLYAFGGYGDNGKLHSVEVYDPRTDVWLRAGDLPQTMADLRAVTYKDVIYLMHEQSLLRYHPLVGSQGEWHTCAKRDVVRTDYGAAVLDDHLYIVGGNSCSGSLDIVQRYSFTSDRWEYATSMLTGLKSCTAGTAGDALVVVGEGRLEMFDVDEDRWSLDTDVPMTIYDEEYDYTYDFRSCFVVLW